MARIRVLQIVTRLAVRGVPRHVLAIAAGLDPERFVVEVLAGRSEPGEGELWQEAQVRGIATLRIPSLQRPVKPLADVRALVAIYRQIRRGGYDIVHTHISKGGILGRLAARCAGVPVVVHTYHGRVEEVHGRSLKSRFFLSCERRAAGWSDALIAVSEETVRLCLSGGIGAADQYRMIHNGIDLRHFMDYRSVEQTSPGLEGDPIIGTIGSLKGEKGLDVLLRSLPGLVQRYPRIQLCVIGDGPLRASLEEEARQLGIGDRVHFPGIVADVRPWLAAFDLFVTPSIREGLPTVLLEAMAMGCPVVASRVGGVPEIIRDGENGLLVPARDSALLEEAIGQLAESSEMRTKMGEASRRRVVEEFDQERMLKLLEGEYEQLLAARRVRE
jgi:glycosyltransferase involved in cell wall biosynthesis